jgi:hypothetical protein
MAYPTRPACRICAGHAPSGGQSAAKTAADWPPSGEWCGQAERMRFARLIYRPVRVLGGPAARAAYGGNQSLPLVLLNVALAALGACLSLAALGGPELHPHGD